MLWAFAAETEGLQAMQIAIYSLFLCRKLNLFAVFFVRKEEIVIFAP